MTTALRRPRWSQLASAFRAKPAWTLVGRHPALRPTFVGGVVIRPAILLGRWAAELDGLLAANAAKPAREQLTLIRIFEELRGRGYDGGYDAVRRYARRWGQERGQSTAAAYVPLSFAPGEAYQFDWSHEVVLLNGVTVIVKAAHVRLCHSRMLFVRCYPRETQEWCSTPTTGRSPCSRAPADAASTTT